MNRESESQKSQRWIDVGVTCGVVAAALYPIGTLNLISAGVSQMAFMLFGPAFLVSAVGTRHFYARAHDTVTNDLAHLSLACAGLCFTLMATAQMSNYALIPTYARSMPEVPVAVWNGILRGVSTTQLGLDFAFDIFVSLGTALLGIQVARHPRIPTLLGVAGTLIAVFGFAMNVIAFPANAGDAGLIDPAPYFGGWLGVTAIPVLALRRWQARPDSEELGGSAVRASQREA